MVSTRAKGSQYEREIKVILEKWGYEVIRAPYTMRPIGKGRFVSGQVDFFNLFDLIAKNKNCTVYVQSESTPQHVSSCKQPISDFRKKCGAPDDKFEVWQRVPRTGFIIHTLQDDGTWCKGKIDLKGRFDEESG